MRIPDMYLERKPPGSLRGQVTAHDAARTTGGLLRADRKEARHGRIAIAQGRGDGRGREEKRKECTMVTKRKTSLDPHREWTDEDIAKVKELYEKGHDGAEIGRMLYRDGNAVRKAITRIKKAERERPCMCCKRPFISAGPMNRLCRSCKIGHQDAGVFDTAHGVGR